MTSTWARGFGLAAFAAVSLAFVELARLADDPSVPGAFPAFWPLAGLVVAALLKTGRRAWLPLLLIASGAMLLSAVVLHGSRLLPTAAAAVVFALQSAATASAVLWKTTDRPFTLDRLPHAVALVAAAVVVPLVGGLLAAVVLMPRESGLVLSVWRTWWLADTVGVLAVAPLVLAVVSLRPGALASLPSATVVEMGVVLVAGIAVTEGILGGRLPSLVQVPAYILPFLLWPVIRFGPGTGSVAPFIVGFLAVWHASRGEGPLALYTGDDLVLRTQGGATIASASVLLLATVVAERKRVSHERDLLLAELERAVMEIKTLEGFIPICAWCHKVRDDAGFWQQLEKYLDEKTDATFSHSICPTCIDRERRAIDTHAVEAR